jgi:hypothetical protein
MIRKEFIIVGCILAVVGLAICIVGYNKTQPTPVDSAISLMENISGERVPREVKSSKSGGYALLGGGMLFVLAGIGFILKSRTSSNATNRNREGDNE